MKKQLLSAFTLLLTSIAFSQTIPNGGFENWTNSSYEEPIGIQTSNSSSNNGISNPNNVVKTTDAFHGTYAIQLNTALIGSDTVFAFFTNGDPGRMPAQGGIPYTQKPTGFRLHYKSNIIGTDSALIIAIFKKAGVEQGRYIYKIAASQNNYTLFSTAFNPALPVNPDTIVFASASSNAFAKSGNPGNMLQIDSIFFTGVTSQPVGFNGDFEQWQTHTSNSINGWALDGGDGGYTQTTDKYTGAYAIELQTMGPSFGGSNQVQPGSITTGNRPNNGPPTGGHPYSTQVDTLVFYYKYIPADPNDSASVSLGFYKNGVGMGGYRKLLGTAVGSYSMAKMTYSLNQAPDTVIVSISSSTYTSYPYPSSFVGSDLKIDNMYFTSQEKPVTNFSMPLTGCVGQTIQLVDSSLNMVTAWQWIMGGGTPSNSNLENPTVKYNSVGSHTISMIATNSFGNGVQVYKHITIYALPSVSFVAPTICPSSQSTLTASGASTYSWSTGAATATISVSPVTNTTYTVIGTDVNGCSSSDVETLTVLQPQMPDICMVTTDTMFTNNIVYWDKTLYSKVDSFIVYRYDVTSANYLRVGAVKDSSQFTDVYRSIGGPNGGDPNVTAWQYKLAIKDSCGNISPKSPYHQTVNVQQNNQNITWNSYVIESGQANPVSGYQVLRDSLGIDDWHVFVNTSGLSTNDNNYSLYPNANYRVDALGFICNPTLRLASGNNNNNTFSAKIKSHSNQNNNRQHSTGIKQVSGNQISVYPNPATNVVNIGFAKQQSNVNIKITSILGNEVLSYNQTVSGNNIAIDINTLASGSYLVHITTDNVSEIKKIVKQ